MMVQQVYHEVKGVQNTPGSGIEGKIEMLTQSVSEVYKYELLTTNQYLKQMELVLEIFQDISEIIANQ